jgi:hypothetical protein
MKEQGDGENVPPPRRRRWWEEAPRGEKGQEETGSGLRVMRGGRGNGAADGGHVAGRDPFGTPAAPGRREGAGGTTTSAARARSPTGATPACKGGGPPAETDSLSLTPTAMTGFSPLVPLPSILHCTL